MDVSFKEVLRIVTDEKEYRYARFLNMKDILERMTISLDENNGCYRINARVSEQEDTYVLSMKINQEGEVIHYHCGCHHETSHSACRHCGALLLFIRTLKITSFPYFYEKDQQEDKLQQYQLLQKQKQERLLQRKENDSLQLIQYYKDLTLRESKIPLSHQQYQLKAFLRQKTNGIEMTLKIRYFDHSYLIKNITTFMNAIINHESLKYGKQLEFVHSHHAFDDDSNELLSFVENYQLTHPTNNPIKTILIDKDQIDTFFDLMKSLPSSYCDYAFDEQNIKIPLEIQDQDHHYILDFKDYRIIEDALMSHKHMYQIIDDHIIKYPFDEEGKCMTLIQKIMQSQGGLYIPKDSIDEFYRYILIDILDYIELETSLFNEYKQENYINLYADMTSDDQICVQIEYLYDDSIAYGFDENNHYLSKEADVVESYIAPYIEDKEDHIIYLTFDHDFSYTFLKEGLPYLAHYCSVYISDALKSISSSKELQLQIGVHMNHNLLEINIDSINIDPSELSDVLKAYRKKRKFYKLKNGHLISLENASLLELDHLTSSLQIAPSSLENEHIEVPAYRLFELEELASSQSSIHYQLSDELIKHIEGLKKPEGFIIPKAYENILREYQRDGFQWLCLMNHYGFSGILADDMGLGKTLQMIVYFEYIKSQNKPSLVITPASLLLNWQDEIQKFSSSLKVLCINGIKSKRDEQIQHIDEYDVVITSYDYMRRDIDLYTPIEFHTIVLDEAQYIKNPKTRSAISVKQLQSTQRFALTGTPIENSLAELWSIFDFLMPHYLYHYSYFLEQFEKPIVKDQDESKQEQLKQMISPFILRRNKKEVLKELPEKIEQTLYLQMNEEEEKIYYASLALVNKQLQEKLSLNQLGRIDILAMLTRLRQICQEPRLLYDDIETPSSKLKGCMELIHSLKDNGKKILLFSSFKSVLDLISEQCRQEHVSFYQLDGSITKEKRKQMVDAFQKDDTTVFLISLKAGGSGLNLTGAQAVIHYDPWWNISAQNQATDRAYRMGQKESVQVFSLIMKDSIEEKIIGLQEKKKNLADTFVEGNQGEITSMSIDDMKSLLLDH